MKKGKKLLAVIASLAMAFSVIGQNPVPVAADTAQVNHNVASDRNYKKYIADAKAAGLKVGVYLYSQATNVQEAQYEANFVLNELNGEALDLPVVYDAECGYYKVNGKSYPGKLAKANLSRSAWTNVATAFCNTIQNRGYAAMFYGSISKILSSIDYRQIDSKYQMWIARYNNHLNDSKYNYNGTYEMWQYSSTGKVPGINTNVDLDVMYTDPSDGRFAGAGIVGENGVYTTVSPFGVGTINHGNEQTGKKVVYGMDVSYHQGNIDFKKAKAAGMEYAIIRIGYARLQQSDSNPTNTNSSSAATDETTNTAGSTNTVTPPANTNAGNITITPAGSNTANTTVNNDYATALGTMKTNKSVPIRAAAKTSAKQVKKLGKNAKVTAYGVAGSGRNTFIRVIYKRGGKQYKGYVLAKRLNPVVSNVGNVRKTGCTPDTVTLSWNKTSGATGYEIYMSNAKNGKYKRVVTVQGGSTCSYTKPSLESNMVYYFKVRAFSKIGNRVTYSKYKETSGGTTAASWKVKAKKANTIRKYAGTSYKKVVKVSKNASMTVVYRARDKKNKVWYKVQYKKGSRTYTGFIPQSSTKKVN